MFFQRRLRQQRAPRVFRPRKTLADINQIDIKEYRLPRAAIQRLIDGFGNSRWASDTERSNAISAETQVRHKWLLSIIVFKVPSPSYSIFVYTKWNVTGRVTQEMGQKKLISITCCPTDWKMSWNIWVHGMWKLFQTLQVCDKIYINPTTCGWEIIHFVYAASGITLIVPPLSINEVVSRNGWLGNVTYEHIIY